MSSNLTNQILPNNSRSHSLASNTTGASDASSAASRFQELYEAEEPQRPRSLSQSEIDLIRYTWHLVQVDTSNICLNFLHQLQRRFPGMKKQTTFGLRATESTPSLTYNSKLMTRNRSCTSAQTTQGQMTQHALKLAVCLDSIIGSLIRYQKVKDEQVIRMLEEAGDNFKAFLGFQTLYKDSLMAREMSLAFSESLRLIVAHNAQGFWNHELQGAWCSLFHILLYYLDGLDYEDL